MYGGVSTAGLHHDTRVVVERVLVAGFLSANAHAATLVDIPTPPKRHAHTHTHTHTHTEREREGGRERESRNLDQSTQCKIQYSTDQHSKNHAVSSYRLLC